MGHYEPERLKQGRSTCRCRAWGIPNLDYFYEMEQGMSKRLEEDASGELKHLLESGEPEEVRRRYGCC